MNPTEIRSALGRLGLSVTEAAALLGLHRTSLQRMLSDTDCQRLEPPRWLPYALAGIGCDRRPRPIVPAE